MSYPIRLEPKLSKEMPIKNKGVKVPLIGAASLLSITVALLALKLPLYYESVQFGAF